MKRMLKTSLFAIMIAATAVSCSKDDKDSTTNPTTNNNGGGGNNNPTTKQMMVGDWDMNGFDQEGDATSSGITMYTYTMTGSNFRGLFTFNADNTYENTTAYDIEMVMAISGMGNQTVNDNVNINDTGSWKINADGDLEITSSSNSATQVMEIVTISSNKLILKATVSETQTQSGVTAVVTGNSTLSFIK